MPRITHHESHLRGEDLIARIGETSIAICGAGALGSNLADSMVRQGFRSLRVIDCDRVEEHNVGTQTYGLSDVGGWKVEVLRSHLFRVAEVDIDARRIELSGRTVRKCLRDVDIVVDAFDNSTSRQIVSDFCREKDVPCLHVGLAAAYGEIIWNANYRVPDDAGADVCDYPLARNIVLMTATVAVECLIRFIENGLREDYSATLHDFSVNRLEPATQNSG